MTKELALLLALSTLWGASYTFIKIGVETIPPITLIAARTLIASAVLIAILRWTLTSTAWLGLGCVIAGVVAMTLPPRKPLAAGIPD